ncbi:DUF6122 family protein [Aliikangiella coralliicola]|uniref:Metal-dependent hydrolase n=1 Tax=Aliikangiella coralliicola TaxID=2592383 RepID=A0A545U524_9GAMM|nr:DUF6122 family protein [Aliikangiella coralliicola]TQV84554.1 hypothetical protein FLL46_23370 [Aliikangiella coralliicola]
MLHIFSHFFIPALVAVAISRKNWFKIWLVLCLTMLVDLDHLLADPIYDLMRCSINFHPLHSYWAIALYVGLMFHRKTRLVATGLLIHMLLDWQDCHFKLADWL